jgi:hypothetical protein
VFVASLAVISAASSERQVVGRGCGSGSDRGGRRHRGRVARRRGCGSLGDAAWRVGRCLRVGAGSLEQDLPRLEGDRFALVVLLVGPFAPVELGVDEDA